MSQNKHSQFMIALVIFLNFVVINLVSTQEDRKAYEFYLTPISNGYTLESCLPIEIYKPRLVMPHKTNKLNQRELFNATIERPLVILDGVWRNECLYVDVDPDIAAIKAFIKEITILEDNQIFLKFKP